MALPVGTPQRPPPPSEVVVPPGLVQRLGFRRQRQHELADHRNLELPPALISPDAFDPVGGLGAPDTQMPSPGHRRSRRAEGMCRVSLRFQRDNPRVRQSIDSVGRMLLRRFEFFARRFRCTSPALVQLRQPSSLLLQLRLLRHHDLADSANLYMGPRLPCRRSDQRLALASPRLTARLNRDGGLDPSRFPSRSVAAKPVSASKARLVGFVD